MPVYAIYKREFENPIKYINANNIKEVQEVYPGGYIVKEISIERIPPKGSLASGVSEKGRQMYFMYEKRFGKME